MITNGKMQNYRKRRGPTGSILCWSSGVASAPLSRGSMACRSSSFIALASFFWVKKAGKKETLVLVLILVFFPEIENSWGIWWMGLLRKWRVDGEDGRESGIDLFAVTGKDLERGKEGKAIALIIGPVPVLGCFGGRTRKLVVRR